MPPTRCDSPARCGKPNRPPPPKKQSTPSASASASRWEMVHLDGMEQNVLSCALRRLRALACLCMYVCVCVCVRACACERARVSTCSTNQNGTGRFRRLHQGAPPGPKSRLRSALGNTTTPTCQAGSWPASDRPAPGGIASAASRSNHAAGSRSRWLSRKQIQMGLRSARR